MEILAITNQRPEKVVSPLEVAGVDHESIIIDSGGALKSTVCLIFQIIANISDVVQSRSILVQGGGYIGLVVVIFGKLSRTPIIVRLGGNPWETNNRKIREYLKDRNVVKFLGYLVIRLMNHIVFLLSDGFIVVSNDLNQDVVDRYQVPPEKVQTVYPPVDYGNVQYNMAQENPVKHISTVTNLRYKGKFDGVCDALDSIVEVLQNNPEMNYTVAGGGMYYDDLVDYADEKVTDPDIRDRIYLLGYVEDVDEIYAKSDIFVYCSYTDSYPSVILEAQASGVPVVANRDFGIVHQINHGESGLLFDAADEIPDLIGMVSESPNLRNKLIKGGIERVERENNMDVVGRHMADSIGNII